MVVEEKGHFAMTLKGASTGTRELKRRVIEMETRITRREMLTGCLTGFGSVCLGLVLPQVAFARIEKETPLVSFETEPVIIDGISFDLPKGYKFTSGDETSSGVDQYEGLINGDVYYAMAGFAEGDKWLGIKPDELASTKVNLEGYSQNKVEQYKTDDLDLVAFFFRNDESPDLNAALLFVYDDEETWRFDIYAKSLTRDDEAAIDVIKQIGMSAKPEQGTTQGKKGALKKSAERTKGGK